MSETLPEFKLVRPDSIADALAAHGGDPQSKYCAGGTDLIVNMRRGLVELDTLVDLSKIPDLQAIKHDEEGVYIGAGVTLVTLADDQQIRADYQAIVEAANSIAGPNHRQVATVGGNLCLDTRCLYFNQSHWWRKSNEYCLKYKGDTCHVAPNGNRCRAAYCGDLAPALLVYHAEIVIAGPDGKRKIPLKDLYQEDGADHLNLEPGELLVSVFLPASKARSNYEKIRVRGEIDFPLAAVAIACEQMDDDYYQFSLAITGTNSMPVIVEPPALSREDDDQEAYFVALGKEVQKAVSPQRTTTIAPHYRRLSVAALSVRAAKRLLA